MVEVRAVDLDDLGAGLLQLVDGLVERVQHAGLVTVGAVELLDDAHLHAREVARGAGLRGGDDVGDGLVGRGRVAIVVAGDDLVEQRGVQHRAGGRATLVQRGGAGDQTMAGDGAVGRLDADGRGQRGRLADRAAGVSADGQRSHRGGQRGGGAAARAARGAPTSSHRVLGRQPWRTRPVRLARIDARGANGDGVGGAHTRASSTRWSARLGDENVLKRRHAASAEAPPASRDRRLLAAARASSADVREGVDAPVDGDAVRTRRLTEISSRA